VSYGKLIENLDLKLVLAIDTHIHADHVTGLGKLRSAVDCVTAMGEQSEAECVSVRIREGEILKADGIILKALYTPGHTDDSVVIGVSFWSTYIVPVRISLFMFPVQSAHR
jgi:sulfur dioxygenase